MDFKPQTFFIGVTDFFSVLLPGAIFTWFLKVRFYNNSSYMHNAFKLPENNVVLAIAFLVVAYITGNILFASASKLDRIYDKKLRKFVKPKDKFDLEAKTAALIRNSYINSDAWILKNYQLNKLETEEVKKIYASKYPHIINVYKWSQYYLHFNNPEALAEVKKTEADSKFFRSLVLTFLLMFLLLIPFENFYPSWFLGLAFLSLVLFAYLRYKCTVKAYELVITHYHLQHPQNTENNKQGAIKSSIIKSAMEKDFLERHAKKIEALKKGFTNAPQQVIIKTGEMENIFFEAEQFENWHCLQGSGILILKNDDEAQEHYLQPNASLSIPKGTNYSIINKHTEPLELMVLNN